MAKLEVKTIMQTSLISEKDMYYLQIGEGEKKLTINIGQTTYDKARELTETASPDKKTGGEKPAK